MLRLTLITLLLLGCSKVSTPGRLSVSWWMVGLTCEEAGVERVEAALYTFDEGEPTTRVERPCEGGALELEEVPPGDYSLILKGFDEAGCWIFSGREEAVEVEADARDALENLTFSPRDLPLQVNWALDAAACAAQGVDQVRVEISQEEERFSQIFLCQGGARPLARRPSRGDFTAIVSGLDMRGNVITRAEASYTMTLFEEAACLDVIELKIPLCAHDECRAGAPEE